MEVWHTHPSRISWNLRARPFDRESDRSRAEDAEVVGIMGVLPDVFAGEHHITPERLFNAGVELVAPAGRKRGDVRRGAEQKRIQDGIAASLVGKDQVLIEGCLENASVRNPQDRIRRLDVVRDAETGFSLFLRRQSIVKITPQSQIERPLAFGNRILNVKCQLLHVGMAIERKESSAAREIERSQSCAGGLKGNALRVQASVAAGVSEGAEERRINNSDLVFLIQKRLLVGRSDFEVVYTLHARNIRTQAGVS